MTKIGVGAVFTSPSVTLYENQGFTGRSMSLAFGQHRFSTPDDFNDIAASIQVPAGLVAVLYEHADDAGGYGIAVDLMEDCPDLGVYGMAKKASFINVIATPNAQGFVWARALEDGGQFIAGHWERARASGQLPSNPGHAAVWPSIPSQLPPPATVLWVNGPTTQITTLGPQDFAAASFWTHAVNDQLGIIGSDYRGAEEIGTAAFERASNNAVIPDWINFWYPQMPAHDHRAPHKRTLVGHSPRGPRGGHLRHLPGL